MTTSSHIAIDVIIINAKYYLLVISSLLLIYTFIQKFSKFKKNKVSRLENYELVKTWISTTALVYKSIFGDSVAMLHLVERYSTSEYLKDTPADIFMGFFHFVYLDKPDDLEVVLNNSNTLQKGSIYKFFKRFLGEGLVTAPAEKWRKTRKTIGPFFTAKSVENYFHLINSHSLEFVEKLKDHCDTHEYFDLWNPVAEFTLKIIWEITFGTDFELTENEKNDLIYHADKFVEVYGLRGYKPWLYSDFIFEWYLYITGYSKSIDKADNLMNQLYKKQKEQFKKKMEFIKDTGEDFVVHSYSDHIFSQTEFSDEEAMHELSTVVVGGYETNALTICFTLLMLAINPEVQEKVYQEIIKYSGKDGDNLNIEEVYEMTYLEQCVKETLRLFSPVPFVMRRATKSFQLNNDYMIQRKSEILIPIFLVHRNPNIYPQPLQWNPDNFSPDQVKSRHKYSFLAFSGGARGCVGGKYAMAVVKISLAKFLKTYRVDTDQTMDDVKLKLELFIRSANGYKIKMYSRIKS